MNVLPGDKARLEITVVSAQLERDVNTIATMDPYCIVSLNGISNETITAKDAGKHPKWMETFDYVP